MLRRKVQIGNRIAKEINNDITTGRIDRAYGIIKSLLFTHKCNSNKIEEKDAKYYLIMVISNWWLNYLEKLYNDKILDDKMR